MVPQRSHQRGNIWAWIFLVVMVAVAAGGVWWTLRGKRTLPIQELPLKSAETIPETGFGEAVETAFPTLSASDKTTEIEAELNATAITTDDASFSEIETELQGL